MRTILKSALILALFFFTSGGALSQTVTTLSPNGTLKVEAVIEETGQLAFQAWKDGRPLLLRSALSFEFRNHPELGKQTKLLRVQERALDETWTPLWGERSQIRNHFNETSLFLRDNKEKLEYRVTFRVYDDGLALRTLIPVQKGFESFELMAENTHFTFPDDHSAWWIPDNWDTYESVYSNTPITKIGQQSHPLNPAHTHGADRGDAPHGCNTPVTLETKDGLFLSLHEAMLTDYAGMTLVPVDGQKPTLKSQLVPWPDGVKVRGEAPFETPWRTLQVATRPGDLVESSLILNLNEPNKLGQASYIKPMKLLGVWWSMHLGAETWGMEGGRHGATTENVKRYIDFAAANGFDGVLVEGWNTGWESWYKDDNFDFTTPYEDFDLEGLTAYGREKGVELVGHLETGGQIESFEDRLIPTLDQYQKNGVTSVKTGYAGKIRPEGQYHHGQWMVRHYRKVLEAAAEHGITVNAHEPIKATGLRRTYPNMMTREGVRGMEWNAWSRGNPPEHTVNLAFTRMLAGPLDYTPGIFDIRFENTGDNYRFWNKIDGLETKGRLHSTLARQLALFVVLYSPIQMASDLPENYEGHPAFQFLRDVPVDWDESLVLDGKLGDYVVLARQQGDDWYLGAITDEAARTVTVDLNFLTEGRTYQATLYKDGPDAHYDTNPTDYVIERIQVVGGDSESLELPMAAGGGIAIQLRAL
jgi:glycosyl hydrolase family 97